MRDIILPLPTILNPEPVPVFQPQNTKPMPPAFLPRALVLVTVSVQVYSMA